MELERLNAKAMWLFIAILMGLAIGFVSTFMADDEVAVNQCMKDHGYSTCHYNLMR